MQAHFLVGFALFVLSIPASAQQIWNVNCQGGPEVHFTDLPAAVAAAAPGDEIRVYYRVDLPSCPGLTYYTAPAIDKPLRIVGLTVGVGLSIPGVNLEGEILVTGLGPTQRVTLSNLLIGQSSGPSGIIAQNCEGSILLEDCWYGSATFAGSRIRFENCADVVVRGCEFILGGSPVEAIGSNVLITTSRIRHTAPLSSPYFAETAPGIRVTNSTVTITESIIDGSYSYAGMYNSFPQWMERPAIVIDSGTVRVGPGTLVRGGWHPLMYYPYGYYAPGYMATGPSVTIQQDPRSTIINPALPPVIPTEIHAAAHNWITAGEPYEVLVAGPLGGFAVLAVGDWRSPGIPTPLGQLAIDPMTLQVDAVVALSPTDGRYVWTLTCPVTVPVAHAFAFQAAVLSPAGEISLTVPSPFAVGWPASAVP